MPKDKLPGDIHRMSEGQFRKTLRFVSGFLDRLRGTKKKKKKRLLAQHSTPVSGVRG